MNEDLPDTEFFKTAEDYDEEHKPSASELSDLLNCVYPIEEEVGICFNCREVAQYITGPNHSPLNGECNYMCGGCLDSDAVIRDEAI